MLVVRRIRRNLFAKEGFCGRFGQISGDVSIGAADRIQVGYANCFEDNINIWFSERSDPSSGRLILGDYVSVGFGSYFGLHADIRVGSNVLIAAQAYIASDTHHYKQRDVPIQQQGVMVAPIAIGSDVWIGCKSVILAGINVGEGAVIGAGSVVTKDVPPYEVWGGVPAKKLKARG